MISWKRLMDISRIGWLPDKTYQQVRLSMKDWSNPQFLPIVGGCAKEATRRYDL